MEPGGVEPPSHPKKSREIRGVSEKAAQNQAHGAHRSDFGAAVASIMALPLNDQEKAEAIRRLLAETPAK